MKLNVSQGLYNIIAASLLAAGKQDEHDELESLVMDAQLAQLDEQRARLVMARNMRRMERRTAPKSEPKSAPTEGKVNRFAELNAQRKAAKEARKAAWQAEQAAKNGGPTIAAAVAEVQEEAAA